MRALAAEHYPLEMILLDSKTGWVSSNATSPESDIYVIPGFFFFTLALFGFSCLSSLGLFANERILFMRERCASHEAMLGNELIMIPGRIDIIHHSPTSHPRYIFLPAHPLSLCLPFFLL